MTLVLYGCMTNRNDVVIVCVCLITFAIVTPIQIYFMNNTIFVYVWIPCSTYTQILDIQDLKKKRR